MEVRTGTGHTRRGGRRNPPPGGTTRARAERGTWGRIASRELTRAPCRRRSATRRRTLLSASRRTATAGARAPIWHVPGATWCFPASPVPFLATRVAGLNNRAPCDIRGPRLRIVTAGNNDPIGDGSARRASHARARRATSREAHLEYRIPRVSSRPRASIRGSRWSFASRSSPAGSVVVGRRPLTLAGTPCRRCRGPHRAPSTVSTRATRARDARRDVRRGRALVHATLARHSTPADADADDDGPMGRRGATVRRRTTTRDPARLGDSARARFVFALTFPHPNPAHQTSSQRTSPR